MKILIIIYAISWLIMLGVYVSSLFSKNRLAKKDPWYLYALIVILAPLLVLAIPYILISSYIKERKERKEDKECKANEDKEKQYIQEARTIYLNAIEQPHDDHSFTFAMIAQTIVSKIEKKDYDLMMKYLDKVILPKGVSFFVEECDQTRRDDYSKLIIETAGGTRDLDIWNYLKVENSTHGAWQAYFLYKVWHILPLWGHGNYACRTYLYSESDCDNIYPFRTEHSFSIRQTAKSLFIKPDVVKGVNGKYYVSCCYWSDFSGLKQEIVEVNISPDNKTSFKDIAEKTLHKYDCEIFF